MGLFTKDIKSMNDLFIHQLKDIYYAEKRIVGALPKMISEGEFARVEARLRTSSRRNQEPRHSPRAGFRNAEIGAADGHLPGY